MSHDAGDRELAEIAIAMTKQWESLDKTLREAMVSQQRGGNTQIIKMEAGGWGVLIALIMVAFLAGLNISQAASQAKMASEISDIRRRNDLANDKLSVILQWAPELAKKVDQSTNKKGENAP